MKIMNQFVISALVLVPFGIPATLATMAENTPPSEQYCEMYKDVDFSGYDVTVRECSAYGVTTNYKVWRDDDAGLVCISNDPERIRFYANEEDEFDQVHCAAVESNDFI